MSEALLQAIDLHKTYASGPEEIKVLQGIDLAVASGEMTAVIGASGSGKTTLLQVLGTLALPTSGQLLFGGSRLDQKSEQDLARFRNRSLGFIFQFHHLLPEFSALENVMMPALIAGTSRQKAEKPARELLEAVELDHRLQHRVNELSGGEQQMLSIARS